MAFRTTYLVMPVAWGDMDAFGHVNNTVYFKYFEHVRILYFEEIGINAYMKNTDIGPILAHTSCRFKKPLVYPDTITISTQLSSIKTTSWVMTYCITSEKLGEVATGEGILVFVDYKTGEKVPIPTNLRQKMVAQE